jgi:hypothetical protein
VPSVVTAIHDQLASCPVSYCADQTSESVETRRKRWFDHGHTVADRAPSYEAQDLSDRVSCGRCGLERQSEAFLAHDGPPAEAHDWPAGAAREGNLAQRPPAAADRDQAVRAADQQRVAQLAEARRDGDAR